MTGRRAGAFPVLLACVLIALGGRQAPGQPGLVILVRHAERAAEPAGDPVLTAAGAQRARDLASVLASAGVTAVVTTHLQRTRLTAQPLLEATGLQPIIVRAGGQGHPDSVAAAVRRRPAGDVVLVVGHSNTIPAIIAALGGPRMPDLCDTQYASLFVMHFPPGGQPRLITSLYGTADPPDSDACSRSMR